MMAGVQDGELLDTLLDGHSLTVEKVGTVRGARGWRAAAEGVCDAARSMLRLLAYVSVLLACNAH